MKLRLGDTVKITAGKDKGKKGKLKRLLPQNNSVVVEGHNLYRRHLKPQQTGKSGQIATRERPLPLANVALLCPHCRKPTRVGFILDSKGHKQRRCLKCQKRLPTPKLKSK